jgi:hypothetical protein
LPSRSRTPWMIEMTTISRRCSSTL